MRALVTAPRPDPRVAPLDRPRARAGAAARAVAHHHVWGDAIAPHGGAVMLPGLIRLLAPFGDQRAADRAPACSGWPAKAGSPRGARAGAASIGSRADGARRFEQAYRRIYAPPVEAWDDTWELVVADAVCPRAGARRCVRELAVGRASAFSGPASTSGRRSPDSTCRRPLRRSAGAHRAIAGPRARRRVARRRLARRRGAPRVGSAPRSPPTIAGSSGASAASSSASGARPRTTTIPSSASSCARC